MLGHRAAVFFVRTIELDPDCQPLVRDEVPVGAILMRDALGADTWRLVQMRDVLGKTLPHLVV
jgi:hypothetical protein